jgi:hypothetical protein
MKIVVLGALVASLSAPAFANDSSYDATQCSAAMATYKQNLATYAKNVEHVKTALARPNHGFISLASIDLGGANSSCKDDDELYLDAMQNGIDIENQFLDYHANRAVGGVDPPKATDVNLAIQKLSVASTKLYGTPHGADAQTLLEQLIKLRAHK